MSVIKEIWCMPHSHLDVGYTHPQPLLLELQSEYISQAIALCVQTKDYPEEARFCWTIEATYPLKRWLKTASQNQINDLKRLIKEKRICVAALPMHTTPNCNLNEMVRMMEDLDIMRHTLDSDINIAINHDVNGQPWTMGQVLLNSGIDFYLTGINIHFGGIPFNRPAPFLWEMADGRRLPSFLGEHYSLFSQFLFTYERSLKKTHKGVLDYVNRLEQSGYNRPFAFLTATNPPLYDNNSPDAGLPELIRQYNAEGHEQKLRLVTAQQLREKIYQEVHNLPVYKGDWTDYWNFGCGSTARETRVSRLAKQTLQKAEVTECFHLAASAHYKNVKDTCYENIFVFDEHTWGASQSVAEPDSYETYSQLVHKFETAYKAADLAGYLLSVQMEQLCKNPHQSNRIEGAVLVNPTQVEQQIEITLPESYLLDAVQLSAVRAKSYVPYLETKEKMVSYGLTTLKPFTYKVMSFDNLNSIKASSASNMRSCQVSETELETPFYKVIFDSETKRIINIVDTGRNRSILHEASGYSLFEPVLETIDENKNPALRSTLFPRDVDLGNQNISQWNHDWQRKLTKPAIAAGEILSEDYKVTFLTRLTLSGTEQMEQRITFYTYSPRIHMDISFVKKPISTPESLYFVIPLCLSNGWECTYDTGGEFVKLDQQQMGNVCRDWVTVDTCVSLYDQDLCVSLACPDAPLVQVGGFHFGKESRFIERKENPLLLAWALNNYWDTNFMANQSGRMQFSYDLFTDEAFDAEKAFENGLKAQNPCIVGAAVNNSYIEYCLFEKDGKTAIIHVYPAKRKNAVNILLKNLTAEKDNCRIDFKKLKVSLAEQITVQEEAIETLAIEQNKICIEMLPHTLKMLRVTLAE